MSHHSFAPSFFRMPVVAVAFVLIAVAVSPMAAGATGDEDWPELFFHGANLDDSVYAMTMYDGELIVEVADRGAGNPEYAQERVFERFYSLPRPDGGTRSSGLGLNFVAEIAQLHGGRASLGNRDGGGALATVVLPRI